jgi:hypothetical protein
MGVVIPVLIGGLLLPHYADAPNPYQEQIRKGREFLLANLKNEKQVGYLGLGIMALIKTAPNHLSGPNKGKTNIEPALQTEIDRFVGLVEGKPHDFKEQEGTYALGVTVSCLIAHDTSKHERLIRRLVAEIIARQKPNGCWTYPSGSPDKGDTSQVQYVTLALWDAATAGIEVPPRVWDSVMWWQIATQDAAGQGGPGGFKYQPDKVPEDAKAVDQNGESATMGVAGLSTLMICQSQLPTLKRKYNAKGPMLKDEMLRPAIDDPDDKGYMPKVTPEMAHRAIDAADRWNRTNNIFKDPFKDAPKVNYYLYGYERVAALRKALAPRSEAARSDEWYTTGGNFLAKTQKPDGSWNAGSHWSNIADTSFALLFLGKTMEKKLKKIEIDILQRSLAIGGQGGLPTADGASGGSAFQRQYDRYKTQPTSSIDELVKIFDDPDKIVSEETTTQVEQLTADQLKELVQKVGGDSRKLRQWAYDKRPEARKAALTALAKTRDPRYVPILLDAVMEKDAGVYTAAREGLRYLSRNIEVFDLPDADKRSPDKLKASVERVREWFKSLNVEVAAFQEFTPPTP